MNEEEKLLLETAIKERDAAIQILMEVLWEYNREAVYDRYGIKKHSDIRLAVERLSKEPLKKQHSGWEPPLTIEELKMAHREFHPRNRVES